MNIKLSIIIPTYKRAELLLRCLTSIKDAIKIPYEIIVVDDSQEGEGASPSALFDVTYIKKSTNDRRGLAPSRNIALKHAKGEFVVFIDDDDFLVNSDLESLVKVPDDVQFVYGNHFEYHNTNSKSELKKVSINGLGLDDFLVMNRLPPGSFAIRRNSIKYTFDEDLRSHEDWDFILKNIFNLKILYKDIYSITMDKTNNETTSHMGRTRSAFWLDFLAIYAKFPCPRLVKQRSLMLQNLGINIPADALNINPYINQRNF